MAGELTTTIAHEITQPLAAILVNADTAKLIMSSPSPNMDELNEIISEIRRDDQRAGEIIKRLRSLLKRTSFEAKQIDLNGLVAESIDLVSAVANAREVSLSTVLSETDLSVMGDNIQLQQVLINLIVNSMDAMAHTDGSQRQILVRTAWDEKFAEIEVADSGSGIPAEKLSEIFEPFYTTKANGMGMGLSIARTIVEAHNGQLSAESQAGQGSVFRVKLPLAAPMQ